MPKPRSFDVYRNAAVLIIAMLSHSEVDMEISDMSIETVKFYDCKEMSRDNGDINRVLVTIQGEQDFSIKMNRNLLTHLPSQSVNCVG